MRLRHLLLLTTALALLCASPAHAATRYAEPGGTGADPCANPSRPCSLSTAVNERGTSIASGDVVELAPGTYRPVQYGEIFFLSVPEGVTVRGIPGKPRPVILHPEETVGSVYLPAGAELSDLEIRNRGDNDPAVQVSGGTITRVIARSTGSAAPACDFLAGAILSSACLNFEGAALGTNVAAKGAYVGTIRNSTLVATGPGSVGMNFSLQAFKRGLSLTIDAVGVIARGEEADVVAYTAALNRGRGATLSIGLRDSDFAKTETESRDGGRASITRPGTNGNLTALPLFATGNLRQLPNSPTLGIGADQFGPGPAIDPGPSTVLSRQLPWRKVPKGMKTVLAFGSRELGARFQCGFDRKPYRACTSPLEVRGGLGAHTIRVRAIDRQGQVDPTPAEFRWRVLSWRAFGRYYGSDDS